MTEQTNSDGGPAFPVAECQEDGWGHGMSLRDYFAAKAMAGDLACQDTEQVGEVLPPFKPSAERWYEIADAMIKARQ